MTISPGQLFLRDDGYADTLVLVYVVTRHGVFEDAGAVVINKKECQFRHFGAERLRRLSWQLLECTTEQSEI
jgi:hypothetical protein